MSSVECWRVGGGNGAGLSGGSCRVGMNSSSQTWRRSDEANLAFWADEDDVLWHLAETSCAKKTAIG